ncbi:MAG TPA: diguanylate cyclase [Pelomicrobium sp.]|nr:diguanylate cyclase [Pelomicrobium sp.]
MLNLAYSENDAPAEPGQAQPAADAVGVLNRLDQFVYRYDPAGEGLLDLVGGGCSVVTGFLADDAVFATRAAYEEIILPKDRKSVRTALAQALDNRERFDLEYRIVTAFGQIRWVWERGIGLFDADGVCRAVEGSIADVTARHAAASEVAKQRQFYMRIVEHAAEGVFRLAPDGRLAYANRAMAGLLGYSSRRELQERVSNLGIQHFVNPGECSEFLGGVRAAGVVTDFEAELQRADGEHFWALISARAITDRHGRLHYFDGCLRDVTRRQAELSRLRRAVTHDPVSGLPARHTLESTLEDALEDARARGAPLAVAVADVDGFREINAALCYATGSQILRGVASRLASTVRQSDAVVHLGGDAFALILPADDSGAGIMGVVQNVLKVATQSFDVQGRKVHLSLSVGIALFPQHADNPDTLLGHAEDALRHAKAAGRGTFHLYDAEASQPPSKSQDPGSGLLRRLRRLLSA